MRPLILSGGPAAGKTSGARALAEELGRAAFVDADDVRQLVVAGAATLWSGPEGMTQAVLAAHNVARLARDLVAAGFEVTVADFLVPETLAVYRSELAGCFVVQLSLSLEAARARATTRPVYLTEDEFELLHAMVAVPPAVDLVLPVDGMSEAEQRTAVRTAWLAASRAGAV